MLAHLLPQGGRGGFKVYGFGFASLGPRNYESDRSNFVAVQLLDFSVFFCRFSQSGSNWCDTAPT